MTGRYLYAVVLALILGAGAVLAARNRRESIGVVLFLQLSFWGRAAFVFVNDRLDIATQKFATFIPLKIVNQPGGIWNALHVDLHDKASFGQIKFLIEALVNVPGLKLFENSYLILDLTNGFAGVLAGFIAYLYMRRLFGPPAAVSALLLISLYPAAVNFSVFGLRDVLLYLFILVNLLSLITLIRETEGRRLQAGLYLMSLIAVGLLRLGYLPFLGILPFAVALTAAMRWLRSIPDVRRRRNFMVLGLSLAGATGVIAMAGSYMLVLKHLGVEGFVSPRILLKEYVEVRASCGTPSIAESDRKIWRHGTIWRGCVVTNPADFARQGRGVKSQYISFERFRTMPVWRRAAIQLAGFIVIPLPWQLTGPSRIAALFDTVFVLWTLYAALRLNKTLRGDSTPGAATMARLNTGLLLSFLAGCICYGLIVTDSGNAFRLRVSVEPFLLLGASLYLATASMFGHRIGRLASGLTTEASPRREPSENGG